MYETSEKKIQVPEIKTKARRKKAIFGNLSFFTYLGFQRIQHFSKVAKAQNPVQNQRIYKLRGLK